MRKSLLTLLLLSASLTFAQTVDTVRTTDTPNQGRIRINNSLNSLLSTFTSQSHKFTSDTVIANTYMQVKAGNLIIGDATHNGIAYFYNNTGHYADLFYTGSSNVALFLPQTNGVLAIQNLLGLRGIDSSLIGGFTGKVLIGQAGGTWGFIDTAALKAPGGASVAFAAITGNATDNTSLANSFATKFGTSGFILAANGGGTILPMLVGGDVTATWGGGNDISFGIGNGVVTPTQMNNAASGTVLGRVAAGTGVRSDLTGAQVLGLFSPGDTLHGMTGAVTAWQGLNNLLPQANRNNGWIPAWSTALGRVVFASPTSGGSVSSVGLTGTAEMSISNSPVTTSGNLGFSWTPGQPANKFLATPNGTTGIPSLRSIVYPDAPWVDDSINAHSFKMPTSLTVGHSLKTFATDSINVGPVDVGTTSDTNATRAYARSVGVSDPIVWTNGTIGTYSNGIEIITGQFWAHGRALIDTSLTVRGYIQNTTGMVDIADTTTNEGPLRVGSNVRPDSTLSITGSGHATSNFRIDGIFSASNVPLIHDTTNQGPGTSLYYSGGQVYTQAAGSGYSSPSQIDTLSFTGAVKWDAQTGMLFSTVDNNITLQSNNAGITLNVNSADSVKVIGKLVVSGTTKLAPTLNGTLQATNGTVSASTSPALGTPTATTLNGLAINRETQIQMNDTIPIIPFGGGNGNAGDTTAFTTSSFYGGFFNDGTDSIHVTKVVSVMVHGIGTDTLNVDIQWHATFGSGSATHLVTSGIPVNSITTGNVTTSFTNAVIPPGVWVFAKTPTVVTGRKPLQFLSSLSGYRTKP